MDTKKPIYVLDTNILVDYPDIIPGEDTKQPDEPTIDLSEVHIVVPTAVTRELTSFKKERTYRAKVARRVLDRLRKLFEGKISSIEDNYNLHASVCVERDGHEQTISIMPIHKNFTDCLPYKPSDEDMDGQIILAAIAAEMAERGLPIDGTASSKDVLAFKTTNVVLLTNDNGMAIRANKRGVQTSRYGYKHPNPYTGRRDLVVPVEMFMEMYKFGEIAEDRFYTFMPDQPKLIANEFIVMSLANRMDYPSDYSPNNDPYFLNIGRFDADEGKIVQLKYVQCFPTHLSNPGQAIYAEALMDPNISAVVCTGPAGSGKTYMSTIYGYSACKDGEFIEIIVVPCESKSKLGALPGDLDEKMDPEVQPFKNALSNYLLKNDSKFSKELATLKKFGPNNKPKNGDSEDEGPAPRSIKQRLEDRINLIWENWFTNVPVEIARGRDFSNRLAIFDEFQDQTTKQADMLVKRIGEEGKIVITGDLEQIHDPYIDASSSGLPYVSSLVKDDPMVAQVCFLECEVVRHPLVKMIAERQKARAERDQKEEE